MVKVTKQEYDEIIALLYRLLDRRHHYPAPLDKAICSAYQIIFDQLDNVTIIPEVEDDPNKNQT